MIMNWLRSSCAIVLFASLLPAQTPTVSSGGVVNAASFTFPVAPGALISIFGSNLAPQNAAASQIPLPMSLAGVSVRFNNNIFAPLLFVSPTQINAQLPWEVAANGAATVVVNNSGVESAPQTVQVSLFSPAVFSAQGYAIAIHVNGTLVAPKTSPAMPGETLQLLATGLGPVTPAPVTGSNSLDVPRNTTTTPKVLIGGASAQVTFSGLSPQFVGVYQVNFVVPPTSANGDNIPLQIQIGETASSGLTNVAIGGAGWTQWGQNPRHTGSVPIVAQDANRILADMIYDPLASTAQAAEGGDLLVHYQVPLVDGNDVYMEFKTGSFDLSRFSTQTWGENRFTWQDGQLVQARSFTSDWKAPGSVQDFWEPVFHAVLANSALYLPGASGSIIKFNKDTGEIVQRIAPFGTDPNAYESGPITADSNGNLFYNAIQIVVDPMSGFFQNDAMDSWLVKVTPDGSVSMVSYKTLTTPEAPASSARCQLTFGQTQLPWPPSPTAVPSGSNMCGTQRVALNVAPAIGPDGTIYSVTRAHFNSRYSFLVAINPDLTKKWAASLRDRFHDGCGVPVSAGGWLPPNGAQGGCRAGAPLGVDPATNRPGDGTVIDSSSSSPTVAPDGTILYGAFTRYNYSQGHLMHFDTNGKFLNAFGFGWDYTPGIYSHDGTWSVVIKNNHYGNDGSYCSDATACPPDRTATNPNSPEAYFISQLSSNLTLEWSFQNTNTLSCSRNADGTLTCVSDHPSGFEWCVNAPVIDANGTVFANSEDGNVIEIGQGGVLKQKIFQLLAIGASYTPASLGGDGKIYTQNDGHLFVVGK
jgi:uncharacterized protein (TIGR03437 family)